MNIQVTIKPTFEQVGKAMSSVDITKFLRDKINEMAASTERYGKQLSPVDTGRLRNSIHFSPASQVLRAVISTGTNYAIYVHEGTRYMRGRPFMEKGAEFGAKSLESGEVARRLEDEYVKAFRHL